MTTGVLCPVPILQFFDNSGNPAVGGSVLTQIGGSNADTFQDVGCTTPLPNPIPLNSRGEVSTSFGASAQCFLTPNVVYAFTLYDQNGNQLWVASYVNGVQVTPPPWAVQTPEEIAAGVVPTNYGYPPPDVRRYGADATGLTETSAAFVTAWTAYKTIYAPTGTYLVDPIIPPLTYYQRTLYGDGAGVGRTQLVANGNDDVIQLGSDGSQEHTFTLYGFGIQGPGVSVPVVFSGSVLSGATTATLATPWALSTTSWNVTFSDGEVRIVDLVNGSTSAQWVGALTNTVTANATTGGCGIHIPKNGAAQAFNFYAHDITISSMGGPGICDHIGVFTSQIDRVQITACLDNLFDLRGGNTTELTGCYAQQVIAPGKAGYRIHAGRPQINACNGINAGTTGLGAYGWVLSDTVASDGRSAFCNPTFIDCNIEDAIVNGIRNKNGSCVFINTTIKAPAADYPVVFTGAFSGGETSGTLSGAWAHLSGQYYVGFDNADVRIVSLTEADTTATWSGVLSGAATAAAVTNSVAYLVDTVNEPGWTNNIVALIETKGSTFANGTGIHTRSSNCPFFWAGDQTTESISFYDETGDLTYTFGTVTKGVTIAAQRIGMGYGDTVFKDGVVHHQRMDTRTTITYSAAMDTDCTLGNIFEITANNGTNFTINNPTGMVSGQTLQYTIKNTSGGALGTITFDTALHTAGAYTNPATGNNRAICFYYNGTVWYETWRTVADVAN